MLYETKRKRQRVGSPKTTSNSPVKERMGYSRDSQRSGIIALFCCLLEESGKERWHKGISGQASPWTAFSSVCRAEKEAFRTTLERSNCFWVCQPTLDTSPNSQGDRGAFWHNLPSCSYLENPPFIGLELSKASASCQRAESKGSKAVARSNLATYKKTLKKRAGQLFCWMRVGLCSSHFFAAPGHLKERLLYTMSLNAMIDSRSSVLLPFRPKELDSHFTGGFINIILLLKMWLGFCNLSEETSARGWF